MLPLTDLVPDLALMVPGCPTPTMERALREAARQFCRETYAVSEVLGPETTVAGEAEIELRGLVAGQKEVVSVLETLVDGIALPPQPLDWLRTTDARYQLRAPGAPKATYRVGETKLALWPTPDGEYTVQFLVATSPTATASHLEDDLVNRWKGALIGGALATLCVHQGVSYSAPAMSKMGLEQYRSGVGKARVELNRSFGRQTHAAPRRASFI